MSSGTDAEAVTEGVREILEFRAVGEIRPPRRIEVDGGALGTMSDDDLLKAYRGARPIGGDFYGRPGKRMPDAKE